MKNDDRTKLLIGELGTEKLTCARVLVVGVGGVGGYSLEMLVRAGIGNITMVDFDAVDRTNINRQIIALNSNIGEKKVNAFEKRLLDINPDLNLKVYDEKLDENTINEIFKEKYDWVIDAIDDVKNKLLLIDYCHKNDIRIISALGSGNKLGVPSFEVCDIFDTEYDGLAKKIRKGLRSLGVNEHLVVYSKRNIVENKSNIIGSISYYPAMCGCVIAGFVITKLLEEK